MAKCSPKLFGNNLECPRRVGYGGLYAEMIYNSRIQNDAAGFVSVEYQGMQGLAQSQEWLHLQPGRVNEWNVEAGENVPVRVAPEFKRYVLFEGTGSRGTFSIRHNCPRCWFEVYSDGPIRYISLMPQDHFHGCRRDVLVAIKSLQPKTIRIPGGIFAEKTDWKDGLKPIEERHPILHDGKDILFCCHENYDSHELNIDDYAAICDYVGAEMEITVRLSFCDLQDAADLVEYCNGDVTTPYGALRAQRGHPEPYDVRTWYIGNEAAYIAGFPLEDAARRSDICVEKMLKVDPTIRTVVSTGNAEDWDEKFLSLAKNVDMCAQHNYVREGGPDWAPEQKLSAAEDTLYPKLKRQSLRAEGRPVLLDEWNMHWGWWGDLYTGLYAAAVLTMLIRRAEELNLYGASYFALVNEGCIRVYTDHVMLAPDGEVMKRMAVHAGGEVVAGDDPAWVKTEHEDFDYISVYNASAAEAKLLAEAAGDYELLTPNGVDFAITAGSGRLEQLPPLSVAFIRVNK